MTEERAAEVVPAPPTEVWDGVERRVARRRTRRRYRFFERRHGFDRRKRYPVLGTMRDHAWIVVLVILIINVLSFMDGYLTAAELGLGIAKEGNPLLAAADNQGPLVAIAVKLGAMVVVSAVIWFGRKRRSVLGISLLTAAVFVALVALHIGTLTGLGILK